MVTLSSCFVETATVRSSLRSLDGKMDPPFDPWFRRALASPFASSLDPVLKMHALLLSRGGLIARSAEMAESIIIHFRECDTARILSRIEGRLGSSDHRMWSFPADDYLILVRAYEDFDSEYEASAREEVSSKLGGPPTASFDFEIRRSRSDDACDVLERFVRDDLQGLNFVVDDMTRFLSRRELEGTHDFLDLYRFKKQAERVVPPNGCGGRLSP